MGFCHNAGSQLSESQRESYDSGENVLEENKKKIGFGGGPYEKQSNSFVRGGACNQHKTF